jgi:hypothetical protein
MVPQLANIETSGSATTPATDDEGDPIETVDMYQPTPYMYSTRRQGDNCFCFRILPNDREFMDIHRMKYIEGKGVKQVDPQVLNNSSGSRYNNCQVCEFEGRNSMMKHIMYFKVHCVRIYTES